MLRSGSYLSCHRAGRVIAFLAAIQSSPWISPHSPSIAKMSYCSDLSIPFDLAHNQPVEGVCGLENRFAEKQGRLYCSSVDPQDIHTETQLDRFAMAKQYRLSRRAVLRLGAVSLAGTVGYSSEAAALPNQLRLNAAGGRLVTRGPSAIPSKPAGASAREPIRFRARPPAEPFARGTPTS